MTLIPQGAGVCLVSSRTEVVFRLTVQSAATCLNYMYLFGAALVTTDGVSVVDSVDDEDCKCHLLPFRLA